MLSLYQLTANRNLNKIDFIFIDKSMWNLEC